MPVSNQTAGRHLPNMFYTAARYVKIFLMTVPRRCFFCGSFLLFVSRVCCAFLSVHCSLVVTCWERANLLALMCVMFSCVFVPLECCVLGQVWYFIVWIAVFFPFYLLCCKRPSRGYATLQLVGLTYSK